MIIFRIRPRNKKIWPGEIQNFENQEIHMVVHAPSRMTKSEEEGLLTIVTTFVSEIYFSIWFLESSCVDESEYVPNLPAAMYIFFTTGVQSKNPTFLGVRSTNPLPAASGLVKLTSGRTFQAFSKTTLSSQAHKLPCGNSIKFEDGNVVLETDVVISLVDLHRCNRKGLVFCFSFLSNTTCFSLKKCRFTIRCSWTEEMTLTWSKSYSPSFTFISDCLNLIVFLINIDKIKGHDHHHHHHLHHHHHRHHKNVYGLMQCAAVRTWVSEMRVAPQYWPEPLPSLCTCSWLVMTMIATGIIIRFIKIIMITIIFFIIPGRQAMATHQDPQDVLRQFSSGTVLRSFRTLVIIIVIHDPDELLWFAIVVLWQFRNLSGYLSKRGSTKGAPDRADKGVQIFRSNIVKG